MDSMIESMSVKTPTIAGVDSDESEEDTSMSARGPPPSAGSRGPPSGARRGPPPGGSRGPPSGARRGPPPGTGSRGPPSGTRRGPPDSGSRDSVEADSSADDSDASEEE